ncbi:TIGR00730 family Rossman fold protein [Desulfohalovibrio reitneri]|uniref:LOG family protein n=1 Tax=Desulfohalovibrio reitneri TaxID=1307759 RepID=UPI0004A714C1|nr:TIGR00730 family Rossman fold protein [Desulfohalovibrio reitneri]
MQELKRICVFLGANPGVNSDYAEATRELGAELVRRNIGLVYGGSSVGLMGRLADTVLELGGEVTGVIPRALFDKEIGHTGLTDLRVVESMHERKAMMAELSNGFVALPGGIGTLEELFEVFTWAQLGFHHKPCGLLDVAEYYRHIGAFLDHASDQGFIKPVHRTMLLREESPAGLLDRMAAYVSPKVEKWVERPEQL